LEANKKTGMKLKGVKHGPMNEKQKRDLSIAVSNAWRLKYQNGYINPMKGRPSWNKGLTKETDERVAKNIINFTTKGRIPWNKGLTKEIDTRILNLSIKSGQTQRTKNMINSENCGYIS